MKFGLPHIAILLGLLIFILLPAPLVGFRDVVAASRYEAAGDYASAASAYALAAWRIPWRPSLWEQAGEMAQASGNGQNAILFLKRAGQRNALSPLGWFSLGLAYQQQEDIPSAVSAWKRALPLAEAYASLAQVYRTQGDFPAAIADWQASIAQKADQANAHYQLGLLLATTAPETALPELMQAAKLDAAFETRVQSMRKAFNSALLSDDRAYQFLLSGRALASLGEWDLAAQSFRNAITSRQDYAEAWAWLGEAKQQQGQDGRSEIEQALADGPRSAMVQGLYGMYLQRQGQPKEALAAFQQAADQQPADAGWQMALGSAYEQTGDLVKAFNYYLRATELAPEDASAWSGLASFCLRNNVDLAVSGLSAASHLLALASDDWRSYDIAGQVLLETGDTHGAEQDLQKALQMAPLEAAPSLHLGELYLQTNQRTAAQAYLVNAQAFDPNGPSGMLAQRLLERYFP